MKGVMLMKKTRGTGTFFIRKSQWKCQNRIYRIVDKLYRLKLNAILYVDIKRRVLCCTGWLIAHHVMTWRVVFRETSTSTLGIP